MTCRKIQHLIDEIGDLDRLPPEAARHVDACAACARFGSDLARLRALLREPARVAAPSDFDARLARRLREAKAPRRRAAAWSWLAAPGHALAATSAAAVLVLGGLAASRLATDRAASAPVETAATAPAPSAGSGIDTPPVAPSVGATSAAAPSPVRVAPPVRQVRVAATRPQVPPVRRVRPARDAMMLVSDQNGTHLVSVPTVLVGAEHALPTGGLTSEDVGVAF